MRLWIEQDKVKRSIEILRKYEPPEGYYVAVSGGKDSTVIYYLVKMAGVKADFHYEVTGLDAPETVQYLKQFDDVKFEPLRKTMWQLILEYKILPSFQIRFCCRYLKERGGINRIVVTGVRKEESSRRKKYQIISQRKKMNKISLSPILFWKETDVWNFIHKNNLPYNPLYNEGYDRIGCLGCPLKPTWQRLRDFKRYPYIKKCYDNVILKLLEILPDEVKRRRGWNTLEDVWDWWLYRSYSKYHNPNTPLLNGF